jgi:hypothetical protein
MAACGISSVKDNYASLYGSLLSELTHSNLQMPKTQLVSSSIVPDLPLGYDKDGKPIQQNQYVGHGPMLLGGRRYCKHRERYDTMVS